MRNFIARVPAAGVLAGLVCLILATGPAFAQSGDEDQGTQPRVRVYHNDDDNGPSQSGGAYLGVRVQEIFRTPRGLSSAWSRTEARPIRPVFAGAT
jgi:hypothetical protein